MSDYPATQLVKATAIQKLKSSRLTGSGNCWDRFGEALKVSLVMKDIPSSCDHLFVKRKAMSMIQTKSLDLFAGIPVADYAAALRWYERLLGSPPTFQPHDTEAVWEVAEHRYVYIVQQPEHAGHAMHTLFVDDLDALVAQIADRGLEPAKRENYSNGVRKIAYRDADGNEIDFGGAPR